MTTDLNTIIITGASDGIGAEMARQLAQHLPDLLNRQVIVDYKPGAGGQFALTALKAAPADGRATAMPRRAPTAATAASMGFTP